MTPKIVLTFLAPLMLSIAILGFLSVRNTQGYIRENVHYINSNILQQVQDTIDIIMKDLNSITLNFSINTKSQVAIRRILQKDEYNFEDVKELDMIFNTLSISHYSRPFINSIYVYFDNSQQRFITSDNAQVSLQTFPDKGWYGSYLENNSRKSQWWEVRSLQDNSISMKETRVLTFYKLIYNSAIRNYNGVVVFNVYADYIENSLGALKFMDDQAIFILDQKNVLISNNDNYDFLFQDMVNLPRGDSELWHRNRKYTVTNLESNYDKNLHYVSVIPNSLLYRLPNYLFFLNILYLLCSLAAAIGLSLYFASISNGQIRTIQKIINTAKNGELPSLNIPPSRMGNNYQSILYDIINTFIEKDYLKIQLSERLYKGRVAELNALQAQINPHFLFNTLQTIHMRSIALGNLGGDISYMIEHLSLLLRYSLADPGETVALREEIAHAKSYVAIQTIRYRNKLAVRWEYEESVIQYGCIKLLLQPLIENSIYHGLNERDGGGEIGIRIGEAETYLEITVSDTGIGMPPDKLEEVRLKLDGANDSYEHIGLFNTNRRIKLLYGEEYGIFIVSEMNAGTVVTVRIPRIISKGDTWEM